MKQTVHGQHDSRKQGLMVRSDASDVDRDRRERLCDLQKDSPIPDAEKIFNPGLYIERPVLSRILYMDLLYRQIIDVPGVIMEFGVRWGQNLALWTNMRGIYEPYNYSRKIIGFDTFCGFASVAEKDTTNAEGDYGVTPNYAKYLHDLLELHESGSPIAHKKKFELVVGDATQSVEQYLSDHPETVVALAYFDFDIYRPTRAAIDCVKNRITKGSVLAFDEINCPDFPGETSAVMESFGLPNLRLRRNSHNPFCAYAIVE